MKHDPSGRPSFNKIERKFTKYFLQLETEANNLRIRQNSEITIPIIKEDDVLYENTNLSFPNRYANLSEIQAETSSTLRSHKESIPNDVLYNNK